MIVTAAGTVPIGAVAPDATPDLALLDRLLRLRLAGARLGWVVELRSVDPLVIDLFELAGLRERFCPDARARRGDPAFEPRGEVDFLEQLWAEPDPGGPSVP